MEGFFLDSFRKTANVRNFYDNGGDYFHQSNDMAKEFHLHLSDLKLQNYSTTTAHFYTLLASMFDEKTDDKRWNNLGSNRWMRKTLYVLNCLLSDVFFIKLISNCS